MSFLAWWADNEDLCFRPQTELELPDYLSGNYPDVENGPKAPRQQHLSLQLELSRGPRSNLEFAIVQLQC